MVTNLELLPWDSRLGKDVVVRKSNFNLTKMTTNLYFYPQTIQGSFKAKPSQAWTLEGYVGPLEWRDLDNDGDLDLLVAHVPVGWTKLAGAYLSKKSNLIT